jgi:hypothetical protein
MSTRACYRFIDPDLSEIVTIYKHSDGYPDGAVCWIAKALAIAWPPPRFEADESAAAFVAANKHSAEQQRLAYLRRAKGGTDPRIKAHLRKSAQDWKPGGRYAQACTGGDLRIVNQPGMDAFKSYADIEYLYDVKRTGDELHVTASSACERNGKWSIRRVFAGTVAPNAGQIRSQIPEAA